MLSRRSFLAGSAAVAATAALPRFAPRRRRRPVRRVHRRRPEAVKDHHELIGTCLDTGHLIRAAQLDVKLDPAAEVKTMGARNFGLHLKDHDNQRKTDVVFGDKTGKLDVAAVLKALKGVKFKGYIALEYEANENDPTADVKACLEYLKEQIKKVG